MRMNLLTAAVRKEGSLKTYSIEFMQIIFFGILLGRQRMRTKGTRVFFAVILSAY